MDEFVPDYEILEMAVAREVDANRFYLALAARSHKPHIRIIFEQLAAEELEHKAKLELEIMKTGRVVNTRKTSPGLRYDQPEYSSPDFEIDYKEILLLGIQKEEASIKLYTDLAKMANDANSRKTLLAIAREETDHKQRFQSVFEHLFEGK
jgi:rubrerythrin